jgi:large subunit ribosomal protein L3
MRGLIGRKIGMTQRFDDNGNLIPITIIEAGPCVVTQVKTADKDGYDAVQVGFGEVKEKHTTKPVRGHFAKKNLPPRRVLAEFEPLQGFDYAPGQEFNVTLFREGERISVTGISKGKGFAGVIKRHGFSRGPETHGQSEYLRSPGSIGQASDPSRVFKGTRMAGHHGAKRVTTRNLEVVGIDTKQNQLFVKGAVPGGKNGIVLLKK